MEGEDRKPVLPLQGEDDNAAITVKLVPQDGDQTVDIKAKKKTKVARLIDAYAAQRNIQSSAIKLLNDQGHRVQPHQTLKEAGIEDGDQLDVMMNQEGGFYN
eukprot:TRINITY_DN2764_c0_g1_i3.p1 TRINITY_DN2764_c0_g1~~TRINITY_DN2764_c0_g1_i3.p1  ORF type:complete len:102 (+),score=26.14 TRINITY_DN2764_c0_g1_i3:47-352(+)